MVYRIFVEKKKGFEHEANALTHEVRELLEISAVQSIRVINRYDVEGTDLAVTFNGAAWTAGVDYNYNQTTGLFTTVPGNILVPAATYTQNPTTGEYTLTPGIATLTVTGTI